jgi:hypothetical protein
LKKKSNLKNSYFKKFGYFLEGTKNGKHLQNHAKNKKKHAKKPIDPRKIEDICA